MDDKLPSLKNAEKSFYDEFYDGAGPLPPVSVEDVEVRSLQPCYTTGHDKYSDSKQAFHKIMHADGGWKGKHVLDYACGNGAWAIYYALTGAKRVDGFDISETAIRRGRERVGHQGLEGTLELRAMDATRLEYSDDTFDVVIGDGVLHHVIKYDGVFSELHRVMKPGATAYFREGLADFPLFRLWWAIKGEVPAGDVPIFSRDIRERAAMFSEVAIHGDTFLYSAKAFLWKPNPSAFRRAVLRTLKGADDLLFAVCPPLRKWGSFSYVILRK